MCPLYNTVMQLAHSPINLDNYFDFLTLPDGRQAIRIAGTRVGIEFVLREYRQGASSEELALRFPTLTLEQIHATITYYLARRDEVDAYLLDTEQEQQAGAQQAQAEPNAFRQSLRERIDHKRRRLQAQSSTQA